jgi:hypothetical protein
MHYEFTAIPDAEVGMRGSPTDQRPLSCPAKPETHVRPISALGCVAPSARRSHRPAALAATRSLRLLPESVRRLTGSLASRTSSSTPDTRRGQRVEAALLLMGQESFSDSDAEYTQASLYSGPRR